jgi:hypothetical protein
MASTYDVLARSHQRFRVLDARVHVEKLVGLPKSIIAFRRVSS